VITIPIYAIHRHRKLWPDPERFDPERFAPEGESHHMRAQFMPFGFGPRICIGMSFAMLEATWWDCEDGSTHVEYMEGAELKAVFIPWYERHTIKASKNGGAFVCTLADSPDVWLPLDA
jgi:hypothetical protein